MIKAVILGAAHSHCIGIAQYTTDHPDYELLGIADIKSKEDGVPYIAYTTDWCRDLVKDKFNIPVYDDYKKMLDELKPDVAFITTDNVQKVEVVEECAKRGIDVSIEKPLAINLEEAKKIESYAKEYGITALVNWPYAWRPYLHKLISVAKSGVVGKPLKLRHLQAFCGPIGKQGTHVGENREDKVADIKNWNEMTDDIRSKTWWYKEECGGGAVIDMTSYGCYLSDWLFGNDCSVVAHGANLDSKFSNVNDDCAAIIKYTETMSVIEGSWITPIEATRPGPMILCENGVVMSTFDGANFDVKALDIFGCEVDIPETKLGEEYNNIAYHYAHHKKTGEPVFEMLSIEKNVEVMSILDAILRSIKSGKNEKV